LVDAIECGIVRLPRGPVSDNAVNANMPVFRNLWDHIKARPRGLPKKVRQQDRRPRSPPASHRSSDRPVCALQSLREEESEEWKSAAIAVLPVFIVVCNNTSSKLVYEWISGWQREVHGEPQTIHHGHLRLFSNFDSFGNPLPRMNTLLIDSRQIESGDALDPNFRKAAEADRAVQAREGATGWGSGPIRARKNVPSSVWFVLAWWQLAESGAAP
jgi:type III restriction enzyme